MKKGTYYPSEATKAKLRAALLGRPVSLATRAKIGASHRKKYAEGFISPLIGKVVSAETRERLSKANKGRPLTELHKAKLSRAKLNNPVRYWSGKPGHKQSSLTRQRISKKLIGDQSYLWRGGISYAPYTVDWTSTLRRSVRERDRYTCQMCKDPQGDRALCIHHIDYNKANSNPANLIALCRSCHGKTNHGDRNAWIKYFTRMMLS